jgi:adenylate cyclase
MDKNRGGAEITLSVLFTDVRGSTAIAERTSAGEFSRLLESFYATVTEAVRGERGVIDKFLGDGVMALFIPSFTDLDDAAQAVRAARRILAESELPIGVGVNTGPAYTGFLGATSEVASFTAVGDAVNVAHRLGEAAAAGEMIVSAETATAARLDADGWTQRELTVKGREQPVAIWSHTATTN